MRTDADRQEKYTANYVATTVGLKVAARLPGMKTGFAAAASYMVAIDLQVQGIMNDQGVMPIHRIGYYNFAREIAHKKYIGTDGPGLKADAVACETKWVAFGFDDGILKKVALDVFGITIP